MSDLSTNKNIVAFLKTIRFSEGTDFEDGYRCCFGGTAKHPILFDNGFKDHPRVIHAVGSLRSSAAGAYQFMPKTWDELAQKLGLKDFLPHSQDLAVIELISEHGALQNIINGQFELSIAKLNTVWASFPGSPYGQPVHSLSVLKKYYTNHLT